ncbi:HlyC/CorC family transporter [Candidatus Dependentiae bacterium]|nr:HlyC/CorC family transporter [Candidatus Dependentiae bacterium]
MSLLVQICLFIIALCFAALFAFLETAFTALRLFKLKELALSITTYRNLFDSWEKNPQRILITILIANNFAHVIASVLISNALEQHLGTFGLAIGVGIATVMILIFGEIIPKSFAKSRNEKLFGSCLWLINLLYHLEYPFVTILLKIADKFFAKVGGQHILDKHDVVSEKEIEFLIDYSDEKGLMESEKTEMLQNIFSLGQTVVREIMIPKADMTLLNVNSTLEQAMDVFARSRYSRLPIYEDDDDNIIGVVHQKDIFDLLYKKEIKTLRELVRPVMFIPETQKINQLLSELLKKHIHMAIILNEYGSIAGLVTLEDIIEEIVGEIVDEHEKTVTDIVPLEQGGWIVDGTASLEKIEDLLGIQMIAENSISIGGFLSEKLQHLPKKGERVLYEGYHFQVQQASPRRVLQVLIFAEEQVKKEEE